MLPNLHRHALAPLISFKDDIIDRRVILYAPDQSKWQLILSLLYFITSVSDKPIYRDQNPFVLFGDMCDEDYP